MSDCEEAAAWIPQPQEVNSARGLCELGEPAGPRPQRESGANIWMAVWQGLQPEEPGLLAHEGL